MSRSLIDCKLLFYTDKHIAQFLCHIRASCNKHLKFEVFDDERVMCMLQMWMSALRTRICVNVMLTAVSIHLAASAATVRMAMSSRMAPARVCVPLRLCKRLCIPRRTLWHYTNVVLLLLLLLLLLLFAQISSSSFRVVFFGLVKITLHTYVVSCCHFHL